MSDLLTELASALPQGAVLTPEAIAGRSAGVWSAGRPLRAAAYVRPRTTQDVSTTLALCHAAGQRVVVHGGCTGLVGGTETGADDLVLSLEGMRAVEAVDPVGRTMTAQAGVTLQAAQQAAEQAGLLLPLDMGSRGTATLGGAAATNAGGNRVLRYGMTRALVLGIEAVLADGTVLSSLNRMLKNNAGFDLKQLFIGSEGTLGVITRLVMRLAPRPASRQTALVALPEFAAMAGLLGRLDHALGGTLSAFEAMWREFYEFETAPGTGRSPPVARDHPFYVLVEAEGFDPIRDDACFEEALAGAQRAGLVAEAVIAKSARERDELWALRDDVVRYTELSPMFMFDVSAPLTEMEAYVREVRASVNRAWPDARFFAFGHLADGNLHFAISAGRPGGEDRGEVERLVYEPLRPIGGSVSAEHGIGLEKKGYLGLCRGPAEVELMRALKRTLDPRGILNPGLVVDP